MPTGSLAPDSPSSSGALRPDRSRRPSTLNTTAGSVGDSAVPSSSAARQSRAKSRWASAATAAAVTNVPATPSQAIGTAARRKLASPMPMPPSNRTSTRQTVTTRCTCSIGIRPSAGNRSEATAAPTRNSAGAGSRSRSLSRLDRMASAMIALTAVSTAANRVTSFMRRGPRGDHAAPLPGAPGRRTRAQRAR